MVHRMFGGRVGQQGGFDRRSLQERLVKDRTDWMLTILTFGDVHGMS